MNIVVTNLHAMSNRGDAAITLVTLALLRQAFPDAHVTLVANHPAEFASYGASVVPSFKTWVWSTDSRGRASWHFVRLPLIPLAGLCLIIWRLTGWLPSGWAPRQRALLLAYTRADLVVNCGGNTLYARHYRAIAFWVIWFAQLCAVLCGKPLVCLPQTIGPFASRLHLLAAGALLRRARLVMVRDDASYDLLTRSLKIDPRRGFRTPDLVFLIDPPAEAVDRSRSRRSIGISVIDWGAQLPLFTRQEQYECAIAEAITSLVADGYHVAFFAQSDTQVWGENDAIPAMRIIAALAPDIRNSVSGPLVVPADPYEALAFLRQFTLVIATRMHAAIFSLMADVPIVPIAYTTKSWGLIDDFDLRLISASIDTITGPELAGAAHAVIDQYEHWRQKNRARMHELRQQIDFLRLLRAAATG